MSKTKVEKVWFEEYKGCTCLSDYMLRKKNLVGYCGKHGGDRNRLHWFPTTAFSDEFIKRLKDRDDQ